MSTKMHFPSWSFESFTMRMSHFWKSQEYDEALRVCFTRMVQAHVWGIHLPAESRNTFNLGSSRPFFGELRGTKGLQDCLRDCTCEKGSSSELGKSYWLRSLALKTMGPAWWPPPDDSGNTFGFFSYFLFCRGTSDFSG